MLETLDHTIRIGSTPTILCFDLYLYSAYAGHYVYIIRSIRRGEERDKAEFFAKKQCLFLVFPNNF